MQLDTPKPGIWWIAVAIGLLGIIANFIFIPFITGYAFWLLTIGFVLLAFSTC